MVKERFRPKKPHERERSVEDFSEDIGKKLRERESKDCSSEKEKITEKTRVVEDFSKKIADSLKTRQEELEKTEEVSKDLTVPSERKRGLSEVKHEDVESIFSEIGDAKWDKETISDTILKIDSTIPDTKSSVRYVDIKATLSQEAFKDFEDTFREDFDDIQKTVDEKRESETTELRQGMVDGKLYLWKRDTNPMMMDNACRQLYFYFKDKKTFDQYIQDATAAIENETRDISDSRAHLDKLLPQLISDSRKGLQINDRTSRIRGDHLNFLNHVADKKLPELEGDISKLAKKGGKGGIPNPRFIEGETLEVAIAKVIGVAVTDCHLKPNGTLEYFEPDLKRIKIVESNLQVLGDIKLNPKFIERDNVYVSYFPAPIGIILQHLKIPSGDRTTQNPGLPPQLHDACWKAKCALIEEEVPQDGTVRPGSISWTHSNSILHGEKGEKYGLKSVIGQREVKLIKDHGNPEKHCWSLARGNLLKLLEDKSSSDYETAKYLYERIMQNPNRLIEDQKRIVESLGVKVVARPATVKYHKRSGRVTVAWILFTEDRYEAMKLAIMAPPNDITKRKVLQDWLRDEPEEVKRVKTELLSKGVDFKEWWK